MYVESGGNRDATFLGVFLLTPVLRTLSRSHWSPRPQLLIRETVWKRLEVLEDATAQRDPLGKRALPGSNPGNVTSASGMRKFGVRKQKQTEAN